MAVGTYYADTINQPVRGIHAGLQAITGVASTGATASTLGDIVVLCKIPHGAVIVDAIVQHNSPGSVGQTFDYGIAYPTAVDSQGRPATITGTGSSASAVATAVGQGTVTRWTKGIANNTGHAASNFVISASDSAADNLRYGCLIATNQSATPTTSVQVVGTVIYYMPPK
jgi:hypothetical protein